MTDLLPTEVDALVSALENENCLHGRFCSVVVAMDLHSRALVYSASVNAPLTPAGRLLAQACKRERGLRTAIKAYILTVGAAEGVDFLENMDDIEKRSIVVDAIGETWCQRCRLSYDGEACRLCADRLS